jgi:hypothetical protein
MIDEEAEKLKSCSEQNEQDIQELLNKFSNRYIKCNLINSYSYKFGTFDTYQSPTDFEIIFTAKCKPIGPVNSYLAFSGSYEKCKKYLIANQNNDTLLENIQKTLGSNKQMLSFGEYFDVYLHEKVKEICEKNKDNFETPINECKIIITDTFMEVLEKFIISHVRNWNNETDSRRPNITTEELAANRLREVENNGRIRPRLIQALSEMFEAAVKGKLDIVQKSVKMYDEQAKHAK